MADEINTTIPIVFDTYPDMFKDYNAGIENDLYDTEKRVFAVPIGWAIDWISKELGIDIEDFLVAYTWDDTYQMYTAANKEKVLLCEAIQER